MNECTEIVSELNHIDTSLFMLFVAIMIHAFFTAEK